MVVIAVIRVQLLVGEIQAGEQFVFFEDEIGHQRALRARTEIEGPQLFESPHQVRELRLECRPPLSLVEGSQERVRFGLHDPLRVQALRQYLRQGALADSDWTFHSDVAGQFKKIGHGSGRRTRKWQDIPDASHRQLRDQLTAVEKVGRFLDSNSRFFSRIEIPKSEIPDPLESLPCSEAFLPEP